MIITRAPLRISFFGGGCDYPAHFKKHGGAFLSMAIDKYIYVMLRNLPRYFEHNIRLSYTIQEHVTDVDDILNPAIKACFKFMGVTGDREVVTMSDVPARTGLGSGSSFVVALLRALNINENAYPDIGPSTLGRQAVHVEQEIMNESVGVQDQYTAAHGGFRYYEIGKGGDVRAYANLGSPNELVQYFLLGFTGFQRDAYGIAADWIKRTDENEAALLKMRSFVDRGHALHENQEYEQFGNLLHEAWLLKRSLSPMISMPYVDTIYDEARKMGAWGGKLLGAGGGGFLLIMAPPEIHAAIRERFSNRLMFVPFAMSHTGAEVVFENNS